MNMYRVVVALAALDALPPAHQDLPSAGDRRNVSGRTWPSLLSTSKGACLSLMVLMLNMLYCTQL